MLSLFTVVLLCFCLLSRSCVFLFVCLAFVVGHRSVVCLYVYLHDCFHVWLLFLLVVIVAGYLLLLVVTVVDCWLSLLLTVGFIVC